MSGTQNSTQERPRAASPQPQDRSRHQVHPRSPSSIGVAAFGPLRGDILRVEAASAPWWSAIPQVAFRCVEIAMLPIKWLVIAAEAAVSLAFVALGVGIWLWWTGRIPDAAIAEFLGQVGKRLLAIIGKAGIL